MSFQFGNSTGGCGNRGSLPSGNYNNYSGFGGCTGPSCSNGNQMMAMSAMGGSGNYGAQRQQSMMMPQMQLQQMPMQQQQMTSGSGPRMGVLPAGQQPDPNMKVIKLNWGDILGSGGQNGTHGLKVAMVGANGDVNGPCNGLKCTFNGTVPQNMPVHVMNINPYGNFLSGQRN